MAVNTLRERPPVAASQQSRPAESQLVAILLTLTVVTGLVDATTYLGFGHVFAANMTGTIVLLGFALSGVAGISAAASLVSLAAFLVGSAAGGVLVRYLEADRRRWLRTALILETVGLFVAAGSAALAFSDHVVVALLAVTMGLRNATVRRLAVPDLTTTVLTMTITGLGTDLVGVGPKRAAPRRIAAVVAMLVGAFVGALLFNYGSFAPLAIAAVVLVITTATFVRAKH